MTDPVYGIEYDCHRLIDVGDDGDQAVILYWRRKEDAEKYAKHGEIKQSKKEGYEGMWYIRFDP